MIYLVQFLSLVLFFSSFQSIADDQIERYRSADHRVVSISISEEPFTIRNNSLGNSFTGHKGIIISKQSVNFAENKLEFYYYKSDAKGVRPLVIVVPPIIGSTPIDNAVTEILAMNDIDVIVPVFDSVFRTTRSLEEANDRIESYLISLRLLIKSVVKDSNREINPKRVCVFGMSLGAVISSVLVSISEDITHAYILAGGGNLSEISQNSNQSIVVNFKKNIIANGSATEENWLDRVKQTFSFEPIDYAKYAANKKIFMIMCESDIVIPYKNQLELWNAFGKPPSSTSTFHSHVGTIIKWVIKSRNDLITFVNE